MTATGLVAFADPGPELELFHGRDRVRRPVRFGLRDRRRGALLVQRTRGGGGNLAFARGPSSLRVLLAGAYDRRLSAEPGVRDWLRIFRRLPQARGSADAGGARHPAIDSGFELSSRSDAGHGVVVSIAAVRSRVWIHPAYFHRASLEHGLQFLCVAQSAPARIDGSIARVPFRKHSTLFAAGIATGRHWIGVELHGLGRRRVVLPDGLRNVRAWQARFSTARPGFLPAIGRQRRRQRRYRLGHCRDDWRRRLDRSVGLAPCYRVVRQVQTRASGEFQRARLAPFSTCSASRLCWAGCVPAFQRLSWSACTRRPRGIRAKPRQSHPTGKRDSSFLRAALLYCSFCTVFSKACWCSRRSPAPKF